MAAIYSDQHSTLKALLDIAGMSVPISGQSQRRASRECDAKGYDPTLGVMHESRDESSAFVFDMMEPERPKWIGASRNS